MTGSTGLWNNPLYTLNNQGEMITAQVFMKNTRQKFPRNAALQPCRLKKHFPNVQKVYGCFQKQGWAPQIIHFNRVFHYKPSILVHPYFWKHPYLQDAFEDLGAKNDVGKYQHKPRPFLRALKLCEIVIKKLEVD